MFKNLICFLGLCSVIHAANINIVEVPVGRERIKLPRYIVLSAIDKQVNEFKEQLDGGVSTHLFIGLDGKVTYFVPDESQLANREKFPSKAAEVRKSRDEFKNLNNINYWSSRSALNEYSLDIALQLLTDGFATGLCSSEPGYENSINIMLERRGLENYNTREAAEHDEPEFASLLFDCIESPEDLEMRYKMHFLKRGDAVLRNMRRAGRLENNNVIELYTDHQIDVTYNILFKLLSIGLEHIDEVTIHKSSHPEDYYILSDFFWSQLENRYPRRPLGSLSVLHM